MFFERKKIKTLVPIGVRFLALVILLGNVGVVYSRADTASPVAENTSTTPIHIVSDRMEADSKEKWIEFIGNVVAAQEDSVIKAERLKIFYVSENGAEADSDLLKKIIADGNVKIVTGTKKATADHAVYTADDHTLVLRGNSRAWSGENIVTGSKITLFLNEDRSIVESEDEEQVEATFYPKKEGGLLK
jgi:lipopolysaccharide export system protein LptA